MVRVVTPFRDRETWRTYAVGDEYVGTPERIRELVMGGYVDSGLVAQGATENVSDSPTVGESGNLYGMTVDDLRKLAEERGVNVPKRATKARLLEILGA